MNYSFPHYLLSKQSVDDRALNKDVLRALQGYISPGPVRIIEVGAGVGTMSRRLIRWNIICEAEYVLVDEREENIGYASAWIQQWAEQAGFGCERSNPCQLRIWDATHDVRIQLVQADV